MSIMKIWRYFEVISFWFYIVLEFEKTSRTKDKRAKNLGVPPRTLWSNDQDLAILVLIPFLVLFLVDFFLELRFLFLNRVLTIFRFSTVQAIIEHVDIDLLTVPKLTGRISAHRAIRYWFNDGPKKCTQKFVPITTIRGSFCVLYQSQQYDGVSRWFLFGITIKKKGVNKINIPLHKRSHCHKASRYGFNDSSKTN